MPILNKLQNNTVTSKDKTLLLEYMDIKVLNFNVDVFKPGARPTTGARPQVSLYPHLGPPNESSQGTPQAPGGVLEADLPGLSPSPRPSNSSSGFCPFLTPARARTPPPSYRGIWL